MSLIGITIVSVATFAIIILLLIAILLFAQSKLVQQGDIKLYINGENDKPIITSAGSNLLSTLSNNNLFLPSACGGGGTCGLCKCEIHEGGGDVLPTEIGHLNRKEIQQKVRLSCQVKVKEDMQISVPQEVFGIKMLECEVISNYNVATFIKELVVKLPANESLDFQPGGYIQINVPPYEADFRNMNIEPNPSDPEGNLKYKTEWDKYSLWSLRTVNEEPIFRAYSMANHPAEGNIIMLNIRIATPPWDRKNNQWLKVKPGICSSYIFDRKPGDKINISGPYGEFFIKDTDREMIYVGGGAGMAPLRSHIFHLFNTLKTTNRKVSYWYGGRSRRELFYTEEFRRIEKEFPNFSYHVALSEPLPEDNWTSKDGYTGFIHQVLIENYLSKHPEPEEIEFYFCGPPLMNEAVVRMCEDFGVPPDNVDFDDFGG